ncbi:MAG: bifunctional phosphopantothenoylcysteine decarboxylase/phosphopantothenate--cysteine ligase CoaBC [Candidatus Aminicenantes bacterium]|nr:bifunctional phosphopantothenoylcysteine decarboxylase/phosphopantothenate--cysteine ligase CoaBC [Candidatus Aminicenantes bacterium]MDH5384934.1 bifunctional phosphopantothenoylcysteine decarboxylase/phosphopantothenate--cysteine ligase CoaBC [Candidatus Aminicenantes bacterium]MDH5742662.1 bifunctional phosphopantothenoylcysteine decarboxylase/phosphopantothenate--cysteine ligase CoaBC [Candidatus Aminicenantes bacterium]
MRKIALGICSSISIYKACEVVRGLQKESCDVQVIMTENATRLVSPLLFSALTGQRVLVDLFAREGSEEIGHVELAKEANLLLVAPATANIIGKFASGVADDFLSTFYLAARCPVLVAPAMNETMYLHRQTQLNMKKLKSQGIRFIEPEKGYLACQEEGWGRLAPVERIVSEALKLISKNQSLEGKIVLVTAGPTREYLDPVRFLSNPSSGKMGFELAGEAVRRGAEVILVSGPTHITPPSGVHIEWIQTAEEMEKAVERHLHRADIVIMAAAVSDFKFSNPSSQKIKKRQIFRSIHLIETPDILKKISERKGKKILVGFAAETEDVKENAQKKLKEKNLDLVVANDVSKKGVGFGSDYNQVWLVFSDGKAMRSGKKSKFEISQMILDKIEEKVGKEG